MRKIEGWADGITATREPNEIASITLFTDKRLQELRPALLLVSTDDKVPEVMTKDQVRKMLQYIIDFGGDTKSHRRSAANYIAAKHGITL